MLSIKANIYSAQTRPLMWSRYSIWHVH